METKPTPEQPAPNPKVKKKIKALIAENELKDAVEALFSYTREQGLTAQHNQLVIQSGRLEQYLSEKNLGTVDYADLTRTRVNISLALLDLANQLPDAPATKAKAKLSGISERRFKRQVMIWLVAGKIILFLYILTIWQSGGLTFEGFLGTMGIVFPVFATYLSMGYQDLLSNRHKHSGYDKLRVGRTVQFSAYLFFMIYYIAIFFVLYLNTIGHIPDPGMDSGVPSYKNLYALLALVESFIGGYIGKLIFALFKDRA